MSLSTGEQLIALMLCDLFDHLGVESEIKPSVIRNAISDGQLWAIKESLGGLIAEEEASPQLRREVGDLLWMWGYLEDSWDRLTVEEKAQFEQLSPHSAPVRFSGFDGNHEREFITTARFIVDDLGQHGDRYKGRALDGGIHAIDGYRRMWRLFDAKLKSGERDFGGGGQLFTPAELAEVMNARRRPAADAA